MSRNAATRLSLLCALLFSFSAIHLCPLPASAQTPAPTANNPVGHWVAEHPSKGGIGSWWDFRADGTLTMHVGAIVTTPITRSGDTFTSPPPTTTGPPIKVTFHIDGDTLHLQSRGQICQWACVGFLVDLHGSGIGRVFGNQVRCKRSSERSMAQSSFTGIL